MCVTVAEKQVIYNKQSKMNRNVKTLCALMGAGMMFL